MVGENQRSKVGPLGLREPGAEVSEKVLERLGNSTDNEHRAFPPKHAVFATTRLSAGKAVFLEVIGLI